MWWLHGVVILSACVVQGYGNSLKDPYICGAPSCTPSEKFQYSSDHVYKYEYKVNVDTWFSESSNNKSTLDIRTVASVQFITACEGLLKLRETSIVDQDENYPVERAEKFVHALGMYDLRFAFHDGIVSELCPHETEEDWVLNFKRGLLSLLQNSMKRFDINFRGVERDIHGTCNVDYVVRGQENTSLVVVKTRDLAQCENRYKYLSILQTVRYNFQSKFQTWPVLKSESKCVITIDHKIYKSVHCKERHLFEPFSGKNSGAMTTVAQSLILVAEKSKTDSEMMDESPKAWSTVTLRSNLLHHHSAYGRPSTGELKSARDVLKMLCKISEVSEDNEGSFAEGNLDSGTTVGVWGGLVRAARGLAHPALAQLLARAPGLCGAAQKHILDALPYIASTGSVELIKEKIVLGEVDRSTRDEWLMSMAMIPRPNIDMLKSMLELLRKEKNDKVVSFTVSSMVHSYCKHSKKPLRECCEEEIPKQIMEEFQDIVIAINKDGLVIAPRKNRDSLVLAIKSLGNIGGFKQEFSDLLMNIISDQNVPVALRLTAVDAFRKTPCAETREYFLEMYREDYVDIEVRLASYLQVMRCPTLSTVRKIFHALDHETVNQAATFVWSHLNNLGQSSLPSRVEIQGLLSGNTVPKLEDKPDFRMFSRNYEQSVFFDQYNAGGNYEANVIFSPDSYIPRSLSLNLTVDMFGESINFLELKARGEGFERYFESIFGTNGLFSKKKIKDKLDSYRFYRSTNDADEIRAKIDDLNYKNEALKHQYPMAELGIKVFGNEISFWSAEGDDEIKKSLAKLNPQLRILEILSGKVISYNKASLFLDTRFSVPTGSGLPLDLHLMGTSYVNINMAGTVVDKLKEERRLDFEGKIKPSVAVNIAATMGVVAGKLSSTGARVNMRLYTATAVEAKLKARPMSQLKLELQLPTTRQQIFAAKSELIILHGDMEHQQQGLNKNRIEQNTCSWSTFDTAIGVKVCAAYQFPNMTNIRNAPYFLMSGPAKYILSLEKADPSAKIYSFEYDWHENATGHQIMFSFDTPNSKEKRMFNAVVSLSQNSSTALMKLQSSKSTIEAKGLYRNQEYDKCIEASLTVDGHKHFDTVMSVKKHDIRMGYVWMPEAYWVLNDEKVAEMTGSFKVKTKGGVTQWDILAHFQTKQLASKLFGYYTLNGPTHGSKLQLDYQFYNNSMHTIKMEGLYSERAGFRHDLYGELAMEFTAYPAYNFYSVLKNLKTQAHLDIALNISASREQKNSPTFSFALVRVEKMNGLKLDTRLTLVKPRPVKLQFMFEEVGPKYTVLTTVNFNPKSRDIVVSGYLYYPPGTQLHIDCELNMTLPTVHPMTFTAKLHEKLPNEYQVNAQGVWFTGVDFNIDALYQDQSKTNLASHRLKLLINSSHFKDIALDARFAQDNRQVTVMGQGEYNDGKYRTIIRHVLLSDKNFTTYAEVDINGKVYSVDFNADLSNNTNVAMDIHFDQLRDVHISYQRWLTDKQKRLSASVNWDANRDPSQKVSIDLQWDNKGPWHYAGHTTLYYPGQAANGEFEILLRDWFCEWHVRGGWSNEDVILWKVKMLSEATNETVYALLSKMNTPFPGWTDTSFNVMWRYHNNFQALNGSMNWQEDYLAFHLLADYALRSEEVFGTFSALVNSSTPSLPNAAARATHRARWGKSIDTTLSFEYNEEGKLMINSSWAIEKGRYENNVTGTVKLISPFQGYRNGYLHTDFMFGHKRDIEGVTFLDLEDKSIKINVKGHMRRITNSMLSVNATQPTTGAAYLNARLGFIEADRHLVAIVVTPTSTTGIEVLLKLMSVQDFHVYGHVALPIQYLNRAMVTAKRAKEELDFRVGWGNMDFGFTGIWLYTSPTNFVYLYKLYTPLEGFEENGFVFKNLYGNGLDTELSIRLSKHKFGVSVLLKDFGKGLIDVIRDRIQQEKRNDDSFVEDFDTSAFVVVNTLYYPTVTFDARISKVVGVNEEEIMKLNATLYLPDKPPVMLTDVFIMEEYTVMRNQLHLLTPFQMVKELKSLYTVDITMGEKFNITCMALLSNGTKWHEISYRIYYEYETGIDDAYQSYAASLAVVTPLDVLPSLESVVSVRLEDSLWKMSADIAMPSFTIDAQGTLELDDVFVETLGTLNLSSIYLEDYFIKMQFKKDFSGVESAVGGGIQVSQGAQNSYLFADTVWRPLPSQHVQFKARAALPPVLPPATATLTYSRDEGGVRGGTADVSVGNNSYSLKADHTANSLSASLSTPHPGYQAVKIIGEIENEDVKGSYVSDTVEYAIGGKVLNREPLEMSLTLTPKGAGDQMTMRVKCELDEFVYGVTAHLDGPVKLTVRAKIEVQDNFTDVNFKVDMPQAKNRDIFLKARVDSHQGVRKVASLQAATPLQRLKHMKGDADFEFGPKTGYVLCNYDIPDMKGDGDLKWSFILGDLYIKALSHQTVKELLRSVDLDIYYGDKNFTKQSNTDAGFKLDLDKVWQIGANFSFAIITNERIKLIINAILPKPNVDVHTLLLDADFGSPAEKKVQAQYSTDITKVLAGARGELETLPESLNANASILWASNTPIKSIDNQLLYNWDVNGSHHIDFSLFTPVYEGEETFKVKGSYQQDMVHGFKLVRGQMHRPGTSQIGDIDLRYGGVKHTDGRFNVTTPFKRMPWLKSIFDINNSEDQSDNKIEIFWPNKTASINTTHIYSKHDQGFKQTGEISISIPLNSQHLVNTEYYYVQSEKASNGNATIDFDRERFVKACFKQVLEKSGRSLDLSTTDIEVENEHTPVGIKYVHEYDVTGNTDVKQATVFHLRNVTKFNVTGIIDVHTHDTGKNLKLTAIQGNRSLTFENVYQSIEKELKQGSKIKWAEDVWLNYDVHVVNKTTVETESQQLTMNVWYPLRTFNLVATYNLQDSMLDGNAILHWNVKDENKTAEIRGKWENPPARDENTHVVDIALTHPSFRKDVTLKGQYITTPLVMSNISLELQYSDYESEYLKLKSIITDNSNGPIRDYKFALNCSHPATNLDLEMRSDINIHSKWYYFDNYYRFQKSLFYQKLRSHKVVADFNNNLVRYERVNETNFYKANGSWQLVYPEYKLFCDVLRPTGNDTGVAVLSLVDKSLVGHYNSTDDISYHIIGMIVDTRSAKLNAWRDFDDVTTVDLASYIRLNHSRLLTSSFVWRPEIFSEVKSSAVYGLKHVYSQFNDTLVILKEIPMEAHLALKNIWSDARPRIKDFLDDLNDLHVIKDDLDEFEKFLNVSYNDNDFYVKDIVEFTYYVLDEMAIRNHLESLPGIVNDMWGMMGNTSQSIKQSLTYVVDTIKKAYANFLESTNKFLEADFMELVSDKLESVILQYDSFVRDLHMKLLEYWETTWVNATTKLGNYWHELLKSMEPLFFKVLHYTESFVFTLGRSVMDFFYNRTQELTDSPYFNYVSAFGHEMDRIYKDMMNNDLITNIKKYTKKFWNVIWGKIEQYIPFKDEIAQLYAEFKNAWDNFLKTPQVNYVREKYQEAYFRLKWWYDYFMIGETADKIFNIVYDKLTDMAKTALQYEEEHRTPKTNFIFDPRKGEISLEQKLPMSWHAFNRTPDWTQISEYKTVRQFLDDWVVTNMSIWSYYNEIRPYLDLDNAMPPAPGMAIMTSQGTLVTFDKRVFTITESGTFLLTKDYRQNKLTVLMESRENEGYNLMVLADNKVLHIDLYKEQLSLDGVSPLTLPAYIGDVICERRGRVIAMTAVKSGLGVECDLLSKSCTVRVTGWYYASLGGLLGTYNNEQYDDLQLTNNSITNSIQLLAHSWTVGEGGKGKAIDRVKNETQCEKFFRNKVSPLHPCFSVIDSSPFHIECASGLDACALAKAYLELCLQKHVPIHIPEQCVQCTTPQSDLIEEGTFYELKNIPSSNDIVFIIEAGPCNKDIRKAKNMDLFVEAFDVKLQGSGISDNRYAVVSFGGSNVYSQPRALYVKNKVFTDSMQISQHFDNLQFDKQELARNNKSSRVDMFAALSFATTLPFRAGVSRTLILMPCSRCDAGLMRLDYSTIYHNLMENSVTLHILMDDDFMLTKKRAAKNLFGVDSSQAYTNKDYETLVGDAALRRQVRLPKEKLGVCTSLALETNGTIFAGKKLLSERRTARRFSTVFGARAAAAQRCGAARCECRQGALQCRACPRDTAHIMDLSFWNADDIEDIIDMAMEPSNLPSLN